MENISRSFCKCHAMKRDLRKLGSPLFSLYLEVFAKFTRGIMRGIKQMSLLVFYLEVLTDLYFERRLLNMSVPWRFEYVDTSYELDYLHPERSEAVDVKHFISVLEMFKPSLYRRFNV